MTIFYIQRFGLRNLKINMPTCKDSVNLFISEKLFFIEKYITSLGLYYIFCCSQRLYINFILNLIIRVEPDITIINKW